MATESLLRALEDCAVAIVPSDMRVGVDLTFVPDVAASIAMFGTRYLTRVYTPRELADCQGDAQRLAARFAAKEAVTKVLAPRDAPGWWRDIEVVRDASGACTLRLHGAAAAAARSATLSGWSVSLTHEADYAAAVVIAACSDGSGSGSGSDMKFPQEAAA